MFGVHKKNVWWIIFHLWLINFYGIRKLQLSVLKPPFSITIKNSEKWEIIQPYFIFVQSYDAKQISTKSVVSVLSCDNILQYLNTSNNQMLIFARCKNAHTSYTGLKVQVHVFSHIEFWRCAHWHNAYWRICSFFFSAPMSVKDVLQSLVDDNMVDTERVGTSNYYWAFPSKALHARKRRLEELERQVRASLFGIWHCISDSWLVK